MPKDHYVPVCYLRGFAVDYPKNRLFPRENVKIWAYDIANDRKFQTNVNHECFVNNLYTIYDEEGNEDRSLDAFLKQTEDYYTDVVLSYDKRYVSDKNYSIAPFSAKDEKVFFARFLFNQFKRTLKFYDKMKLEMPDNLRESNKKKLRSILNYVMSTVGETPINPNSKPGLEYFLDKNWTLFVIIDPNKRFITSDCPVSLMENDGIALDNTEISMPLNEHMVLHLHKIPGLRPVEIISAKARLNHQHIREMNVKIAYSAYKYFYSSNEALLSSIINAFKDAVKGIGLDTYNIK